MHPQSSPPKFVSAPPSGNENGNGVENTVYMPISVELAGKFSGEEIDFTGLRFPNSPGFLGVERGRVGLRKSY